MNTKLSFTTLIAAATLGFGGFAMAQPTSTPGAGCTATANAMRGGNLGSSPTDAACTTAGSKAATPAAAAATTTTTQAAPSTTSNAAVTSGMGTTAVVAERAPVRTTRVARAPRADRN